MKDSERSRFRFEMTHHKDGTPIKDLETKGPFLGIVELGRCSRCGQYQVVIDCADNPEEWVKLAPWRVVS